MVRVHCLFRLQLRLSLPISTYCRLGADVTTQKKTSSFSSPSRQTIKSSDLSPQSGSNSSLLKPQQVLSLQLDWQRQDMLRSLPILSSPSTAFISFASLPSTLTMSRLTEVVSALKVSRLPPQGRSLVALISHRAVAMKSSSLVFLPTPPQPSKRRIFAVSASRSLRAPPARPRLLLSHPSPQRPKHLPPPPPRELLLFPLLSPLSSPLVRSTMEQ
jgi:hypothetical protein